MSYNYLTYLQRALLTTLLPLAACSSSATVGGSATDGMGSDSDSDGTTGGDEGSTSTSSSSDSGETSGDPGTTSTGTSSTGGETSDSAGDTADDTVPGYGDGEGSCDPEVDTLLGLTLPDSNAMVSPVQARMAVLDGWGVFGDLFIRPWEFLAYYPFSYTPAPAGTLALEVELYAPKDQPEGSYELQVGIAGPWMNAALRPPLDLTLVVDISGSMKGVPLTILKDACSSLIGNLRAGDQLSLVTWSSEEPVLLAHHQVAGPQDPTLIGLIDGLEATGGSDLYAGLSAGYALAAEGYDPTRTSRVILMSDGGAAADAKTLDLIAEHAADTDEQEGIYLLGVGVGTYGGYQPALMDSVAGVGNGSTLFVGSTTEAQALLGERFLGLMLVAARDLEVEVLLPPGFRRRLPKEFTYNDVVDPLPLQGQPLRQNEALVYFERLSSCAPEQLSESSPLKVTLQYRDAKTFQTKEIVVETTFGELLAKGVSQLHKGAAIVRYSETLRLWNEAPGAPETYINTAESALGRVMLAKAKLPEDPSLVEIQSVLETLLESLK